MASARAARRTRQDVLRDFRTDQIVEAAWDVIGELGYTEASIDRIAERAGVARSTVYVYFDGKDAILDACIARGRAELGERISAGVASSRGLEPRLAAFLRSTLEYVDENLEFFHAVMAVQGMQAFFPQAGALSPELRSLREDLEKIVGGILAEGIQSGLLTDDDTARAADDLATLLYGALLRRSREPAPPPAGEAAVRLAHLFLHGVTRAPG
jgi:AcrR family transcriptional regulator